MIVVTKLSLKLQTFYGITVIFKLFHRSESYLLSLSYRMLFNFSEIPLVRDPLHFIIFNPNPIVVCLGFAMPMSTQYDITPIMFPRIMFWAALDRGRCMM